MACDEVTWRSRDGSWGTRLRQIGIHEIQDSLGIQYDIKDYIGKLGSRIYKNFIFNLNNIFYIFITI